MNISKGLVARGAIAVAALAVALVAGRSSLALALAERRPAQALQLDPRQSTSLALTAHEAVIAVATTPAGAKSPEVARAERDALKALSIDPTNVAAVADVALVRELQGRSGEALKLMRYAEQVSRRHLITQLWWIEYYSAQGDITRTLEHYDIALRTSSRAPSILFPILVNASADPAIAMPLARMATRRPLWAEQLVQQLAQSSQDSLTASRFLGHMAAFGQPAPARALITTLDRLIQAGQADAAWALYARYRPDAAQRRIRNPDFSSGPAEPTVFDWQLNQEGLSTSIDQAGLHIDASPGGGGVAARQMLRLPPGKHRLRFDFTTSNRSETETTKPLLTVRCVATGAALGNPISSGSAPEALTVDVPQTCRLQMLEIAMQAADSPGGVSAVVRAVQLID